jgi:cobalt-zinc-cadmium efflux system protein
MSQHDHSAHLPTGTKLVITIVLNFIITIGEVIGGLLSGSLSLLSDALHNFSDTISVIISFIALRLSRRENSPKKTFGYKRAEVLAAFINSLVLIFISFYLFKEAVQRLIQPTPIDSQVMIIVALVGLFANIAAVVLLHRDSKENLNIKSAYFHLLADALSSVGVVVGGIFIWRFQVYWLDPLLTIMIGIYILRASYQILKQSLNILIQATPVNIDFQTVIERVKSIPPVINFHHVHIWQLNDKQIHLEGHLEVNANLRICDTDEIRQQVEQLLHDEFEISHITLQVESDTCADKQSISQDHA